jgi:uncharacterized protein (DUF362 family)
MSIVCITKVRNEDIYSAVNSCFKEIISNDTLKGVRKVLIKPNLVNSSAANTGVTTNLRIIAAYKNS